MPTKIEKDDVTGRETTGHEWDGLRELNTPLPKWWIYVFAATVVWAMGYFVLYPSIPYGSGYFKGVLGYSTRQEAMEGWKAMQGRHAAAMGRIAAAPLEEVRKDPELLATAMTAGRVAFANNCQPCHGPGGEGRVGYPALGDDVWLWGGKPDDVLQTVAHGIRSGDPEARMSAMPNFGADGVLTRAQIEEVADYVSVLFGGAAAKSVAGRDTAPGQAIYAENCAACHGEKGQGNRDMGAPPLASTVHLYGSDRASIVAQVTRPRHGVMPAWTGKLDAATLKSVTLYVHSLGGGE